jgi:hypothetical protein
VTGRTLLMAVVALAGFAGATGLAVGMSAERRAQLESYEQDLTRLRKAAGSARAQTAPTVDVGVTRRTRCVKGVDTFSAALQTSVPITPAMTREKRLDALLDISAAATRAERRAELRRPAPTLPKRMGSGSGTEPLVPEARACDGTGFAELD